MLSLILIWGIVFMNDIIINKLKKECAFLEERNTITEADVSHHIIDDVFIAEMGYDKHECVYEENAFSGRQDIVTGKGKDVLTIETKRLDHKIEYKDKEQVVRYLNNKGREWGLVTNGKEFVLLNTNIVPSSSDDSRALEDIVVFHFDINNSRKDGFTEHKFFDYLSHERLFVTKTTYYFKYIQQFRILNTIKRENWRQYKSALFGFFNYTVEHEKLSFEKTPLEMIGPRDFYSFIKYKESQNKNRSLSSETIKNNWSYISSMFNTLRDNGYISGTLFGGKREPYIEEKTDKIKGVNYLTDDNIRTIISFYANRTDNPERNIAAFILCCAYGFERSDVVNLIWKQVSDDLKTIYINDRKIHCDELLHDCLNELKITKKKKKIKIDNVFCTFQQKKKKYESFKDTTLNDIFNRITQCGKEEYWKQFSPKYVKICSIKRYFENGYSLDEIVYLTGIDIGNIKEYISTSDVLHRWNSKTKRTKDAFDGILDSRLKDWKKP